MTVTLKAWIRIDGYGMKLHGHIWQDIFSVCLILCSQPEPVIYAQTRQNPVFFHVKDVKDWVFGVHPFYGSQDSGYGFVVGLYTNRKILGHCQWRPTHCTKVAHRTVECNLQLAAGHSIECITHADRAVLSCLAASHRSARRRTAVSSRRFELFDPVTLTLYLLT